jgi:transcription elongation factor Elf1
VENAVGNPAVVTHANAPYADSIIPLFLSSITGMRYRTLNCMECGAEFLERNNDTMYRLNDDTLPTEVAVDGASVKARCGNCSQWYAVQVSMSVTLEQGGVPLYLQPQSVYIAVDSVKKLRFMHCLECGHAFQTISDRISQVIDNRVPFEFVDPGKIGPIESLCHFNNCGQTWALML